MKPRLLFLIGTRPEVIKLAPLVRKFREDPDFETHVCLSAQHRELLDQMLDFFDIRPDYDLDLMKHGQRPLGVLSEGLSAVGQLLSDIKPDMIFVQGDTTNVLVGALAGAHLKVPVAHVEAGLRSHDVHAPFPEEYNRKLTAQLADFHFAPTEKAVDNLFAEGITKRVHLVRNTAVDALLQTLSAQTEENDLPGFGRDKKVILVTCHRRETFGEPLIEICSALKEIVSLRPDVEIIYPVHLNPRVQEVVLAELQGIPGIRLIDPLTYPEFVRLMQESYFILTDSGGIQEEAPSLNKPVLVLRNKTERAEGIEAGTAKLVGTEKSVIVEESIKLIDNADAYGQMAGCPNPYGDGKTSERIHELIRDHFFRPEVKLADPVQEK